MKINRVLQHLLTFGLVTAIALSVGLSFLMWINPAHYESNVQKNANTTTEKNNLNVRPISSVYAPTQLIQNIGNQQNLLINPSINMINEIKDNFDHYRGLKLHSNGRISNAQALRLLNKDQSLVLSYSSSVTLSIVNKLFHQNFTDNNTERISFIIIPLGKRGEMYFYSNNDQRMYTLTFNHSRNNQIQQIVDDTRIKRNQVHFALFNHQMMLKTNYTMTLPQYSYLINTQSQNYYAIRLLGDTQNINVKRRHNSTIYNDQSARQITFANNGDIDYVNDEPQTTMGTFNTILNQNYNRMVNSGAVLDTVHFFDYTAKTHQFDYRMYVEGFPIFSENDAGLFRIRFNDVGTLRMKFSLNSLQIPTPNTEKQRQLPSTEEVLHDLYARGYKSSQIQRLVIAYHWESDRSSQILVNLVPSWHVKINNNWYNLNTMLNK